MATITAAAGGGNWSATGTWTGNVVPTSADDVILASTSGSVVIDTASAVCRSLDCQATGNYAATLSSSAGGTLTIGTSTTNGSLGLRFSTTMTWSPSTATTLAMIFASSSATQVQITTAGRPMGTVSWNTAGGSYLLTDTWVAPIAATATATLTAGTLNTNGQTITWGIFSLGNSGVRTLTLGASNITITGVGSALTLVGNTNITMTANTATFTLTGASVTWNSPTFNWNGASIVMSGSGNATIAGVSPTVANFTRTGTAVKTDLCILSATSLTCTGTFTCNGNSLTNRVLIQTSATGTQRTITAAVVSLSNVDFMDITGAGAGTWSGTSIGDCGGNSGITFTPSVIRYAVVGGSVSSTAMWSGTSGGAGGSSVPLSQDDVRFNANSAAGTYLMDMPRIGGINFTGFTRTFSQAIAFTSFGDWTLYAAMTFTSGTMTLAGRGAQMVTCAGKSFNNLTINGFGGTYTAQDDFVVSASYTIASGGFDANGHNVTLGSWTSSSGIARATTMGSGTWTLTGTGTVISWISQASYTLNAGTSTLVISDTSSTAKTLSFAPPAGSPVLNNLTITGGGTGLVTFNGAVTINVLTIGAPKSIAFTSSQTTTVAGFVATGSSGNLITITAVTAGTHATLSCASGIISCDWLSLKDSTATGGAVFYAGANSTNVSGNVGWLFTAAPSSIRTLLGVGV